MDNLFLSNNVKVQNKGKNSKKDFNEYKNETIKSLYEVEHFLTKTKGAINKIKLVKIIK